MKKLAIVLLAFSTLILSGCGADDVSTNGTTTIITTTSTVKSTTTTIHTTAVTTQTTTQKVTTATSKTSAKKTSTTTTGTQTTKFCDTYSSVISFEEGKKMIAEAAKKYMQEHHIDPKTAGETGETCSLCGKKIWNANKYGIGIPGRPQNGFGNENSTYCNNACGIIVN